MADEEDHKQVAETANATHANTRRGTEDIDGAQYSLAGDNEETTGQCEASSKGELDGANCQTEEIGGQPDFYSDIVAMTSDEVSKITNDAGKISEAATSDMQYVEKSSHELTNILETATPENIQACSNTNGILDKNNYKEQFSLAIAEIERYENEAKAAADKQLDLEAKITFLEAERITLIDNLKTSQSETNVAKVVIANLKQSNEELSSIIEANNKDNRNKEKEWKQDWRSLLDEQKAVRAERNLFEKLKQMIEAKSFEMDKQHKSILQNEKDTTAANETLKSEIRKLQEDLKRSEGGLAAANKEIANDQSVLKSRNDEISALKVKLQQVESSIDYTSKKLTETLAQLDGANNSSFTLTQQNRELVDERIQLTSQMMKEREHTERVNEAAKSNAKRIIEQGEVIESLNKKIEAEIAKNAALDVKKQEMEDELTAKYREKSNEFELESAKNKRVTDEKAKWFGCVQEQGKEINKLKETKQTLENTIMELKRDKKNLEGENMKVTEKTKTLEKSMRELTMNLEMEKKQYTYVWHMMQQKLQEKAMVETSMVSSVGEIEVLKAQIAAKDQIIHQQQYTKEEAESKLRQAQSALATVNELEESLKESQEEKQRLKDELEKAARGYRDSVNMMGERSSEADKVSRENSRLSKELRGCKERLEIVLKANKRLEEKCQLLQQDLQSASFDFERSYD